MCALHRSSYEFGTLTLDDGFAMGSSMMPQKKNPGPLELLRGRSGRAVGLHVGAMMMLKGAQWSAARMRKVPLL